MKFLETPIQGMYLIEPELLCDERGFFARMFCQEEFLAHGLNPNFVQGSTSFNHKKGTLRGMHYQKEPFEEDKLVRCTKGALWDVVLDVRPHSPTFKRLSGIELTEENRRMLYIPKGCAHGFQTLQDNTEIAYQMTALYDPFSATGIRWNDQSFQIQWPLDFQILSPKDAQLPDFKA
jgi:dTDP-4-dehydrorhamnose 3,5-epimerase